MTINFYTDKNENDEKIESHYIFGLALHATKTIIEPILAATKVTGSQVVEVAVMAYALSTRSDIHKSLRFHCLKEISHTAIK